MRTVNPMQWRVPSLAALRVPSVVISGLGLSEKFLVLSVLLSAFIDIVNDAVAYFSDAQGVFLAVLKGVILVVVIANFRTVYSYVITISFLNIFLLREMIVVFTAPNLYFLDDAVVFIRILFFIVWLLLFYERRDRQIFLDCILKIFVVLTVLSVACQMIGTVFHLSYFLAYPGMRDGYKGIFNSANDTSVFYLLSLIYAMYLWKHGKHLYLLVSLAGLFALALGSKTSLFGAILIPLLYLIFDRKIFSSSNLKKILFDSRALFKWLFGISLFLVFSYIVADHFTDIMGAINYEQFLRVYRDDGLVTSILSGRDAKASAYFQSIQGIPGILFGQQLSEQFKTDFSNNPATLMYEIDGIDYLARVGLVGTLLTLAVIWKTTAMRRWNALTPEQKTLIVSIFILGATVGHTLISSMNGIWIGFWYIAYGSEYSLSSHDEPGAPYQLSLKGNQ